jgi:hypothetical protein
LSGALALLLQITVGNMTLWLKSRGLSDRKSTESSNVTFLPSSHAALHLRSYSGRL